MHIATALKPAHAIGSYDSRHVHQTCAAYVSLHILTQYHGTLSASQSADGSGSIV